MTARNRRRSRASSGQTPAWLWMLFGLSIGLVVAAAVYVSDRRGGEAPLGVTVQATPTPQTPAEPAPDNTTAAHPGARFDFYEILPRFEVVIPEVETQATPDRVATAVGDPGTYVLQAGSFRAAADAERMKATLALLGLESRIQRVTIDTDDYHRVRIGPTGDLEELNEARRRLWDAQIEVLLIKVPD